MLPNLELKHSLMKEFAKWLPTERITRIRNMALVVTGLFLGMSIHLSHIVREWPEPGRAVSLTNRLRRFLDNPRVEVRQWYRPVVEQVVAALGKGGVLRLILDGTGIGRGYRLFTVSIAYRKRAIPLAWRVYEGGRGHITTQEQIALLAEVAPFFDASATVWVLGDSAFEHVPLLRWIRQQGWHFAIRQQGRILVAPVTAPTWQRISDFPLQPGQTQSVGWVHLTHKHAFGPVWLLLHWAQGESEPWYLVSDQPGARPLLRHYRYRMWTEELYGDLKGHGFDLAATRLLGTDRLNRLVLALFLTYVWLITLGAWVVKRGYRPLIDRKSRRDKSYFRLGVDWLKRALRLGYSLPLRFCPYP